MFSDPKFSLDAEKRTIHASFSLDAGAKVRIVACQIYDPETGTFIAEGEWKEAEPGQQTSLDITLPPERGRYRVYLSGLDASDEWLYLRNEPFLLLEAQVEGGRAALLETRTTTLRALRRRTVLRSAGRALTLPVTSLWKNRSLIRSMVRRDIMARYRGSFGDVLWTVLNPLLLTATYFFVFGVVLQSRIGSDTSRTGFVLYLLAGMLPWLAFSEAVGRSPWVLVEHRNFIRKLVFPVEILPATQTVSALITETFALGIFAVALLALRGRIPVTAIWLPLILIPQFLLTLGTAWFLSALGVFMRDLGQIIGFVLTLLFFLTPICYPEASVPAGALNILSLNPVYMLVRCYRAIFLESAPPPVESLWKLWSVACVVFVAGHACFYKLRKSFADVI